MGISPTGPHLGRDPDRLHQFLARGTITKGCFRVAVDAIGALRYMRNRNRDELLGLCRQSSAGKDLPANLNAWKAFSVSGVSARRFWESSGEEDGEYKGLVIMGLRRGSVLPAPES